jgi:hypothetical protein
VRSLLCCLAAKHWAVDRRLFTTLPTFVGLAGLLQTFEGSGRAAPVGVGGGCSLQRLRPAIAEPTHGPPQAPEPQASQASAQGFLQQLKSTLAPSEYVQLRVVELGVASSQAAVLVPGALKSFQVGQRRHRPAAARCVANEAASRSDADEEVSTLLRTETDCGVRLFGCFGAFVPPHHQARVVLPSMRFDRSRVAQELFRARLAAFEAALTRSKPRGAPPPVRELAGLKRAADGAAGEQHARFGRG